MSRDLEEFLRMAAARRQAAQGQGQSAQGQAGQQNAARPQQRQRPNRLVPPPIVDAEVIEEIEIIEPLRPTIQSRINTSDIQSHVSHLGERVSSVHDRVEEDIHRKFDHEISRLDDDDGQKLTSPEGTANAALELVELLRNPKSIAQAVILREILDRPNFD